MRKLSILCALGLLLQIPLAQRSVYGLTNTAASVIRVAILTDISNFDCAIQGGYKLTDQHNNILSEERKALKDSTVEFTSKSIMIAEKEYSLDWINIQPTKDASIYVNRRRFRGSLSIIRTQDHQGIVVNTVDLEDYIKGVLYHEISHRWPMEAMKAQAVAARTYALYQKNINKNKTFDVRSDIYSQVYGGRHAERYRTNIAVNRTKGLVMTYQGKIIPAYYHATCAGHTEDASNLWKGDWPCLKGVVCPYCRQSPHFSWKKNIQLKEIQEKLNAAGYALWLIKDIEILERNKSGRIDKLLITTRDNKTLEMEGKTFRDIIGPNIIKSNNYQTIPKGYYMDFSGKGWGHGVGLCQWGVNFMARERYSYDKILKFYYPGVDIVSMRPALMDAPPKVGQNISARPN
ncbi:MAG: SpoIID/LytB domain-containing protein [Candidatus Omnitrophota bacterium]